MNVRAAISNPRAIVGAAIIGCFVLVALLAPIISPYSPTDISFTPGLAPSSEHLLGTTQGGQDILSQLIWGTRTSVAVGLMTALLICLVQLVTGVFAGYVGGATDTVSAIVTNVFLVLPALPLLIVLSAYLQGSGGSGSTPVLIGVIVLTGWAWGARVLRSQAIALRDRTFVEAARVSGEGRWHIVRSHIVPNMLGIMVANFFGAAMFAVLAEAGLEFIGLGNINSVSWGTMLYWAQNDEATLMGQWIWLLVPGLCILLFGTALGLLNFAIDEIANPNLRRD
jgi:peptide/nickel transport system permease protein